MKIAFHSMVSQSWTAGLTALELFFHALRRLAGEAPAIALTVWENSVCRPPADWNNLIDDMILLPACSGESGDLTALLQSRSVDVFFSLPISTALRISLPRIVWLYDFQHRHFPELFSAEEIARRDRLFLENARSAKIALLTAEAVAHDFKVFAPELAGKIRVLPFVPHIPEQVYREDPRADLARLHLPEKFFFLPNQFYRHKNHAVVLDALRLLRERGRSVTVVCTGNMPAPEKTPFFRGLMDQRARYGLEKNFIMLGLAPRDVFFRLMRQSVCVLNPTFFEGFGLSLAESRFVGKRALVADLPVLREQGHPSAEFFNPADAGELADKMAHIWEDGLPGVIPAQENAARKSHLAEQERFARGLLETIKAALV